MYKNIVQNIHHKAVSESSRKVTRITLRARWIIHPHKIDPIYQQCTEGGG